MRVRITQIDGKLPNLALMRLAAWHRDLGDEIVFSRSVEHHATDGGFDVVYGSAIFKFSSAKTERFKENFPGAILGGTGTDSAFVVEDIVPPGFTGLDYSLYPDYAPSLGFTQRGCRLKCKFCIVPSKEGGNRDVGTVADIWRGAGHPKKLHLLDNDFFGQPREQWQARVREINDGGFRVCLNQGINVRLIDDEAAAALASMQYRDDQFQKRRLYTAWDNLKDEKVFFRGVDMLERAGIPAKHIMVYMLVGFAPDETWERALYRFDRMVERGLLPYPMVFDRTRKDLKHFQRWVVTGLYRAVSFADYRPWISSPEGLAWWNATAVDPLIGDVAV